MRTLPASPGQHVPTWSYSAYGLGLRSAVPLPAAVPCDGASDVEVRRAPLPEIAAELRGNGSHAVIAPGEARLLLPRIGTFVVRGGREIVVDPDPQAGEELLGLGILGPALAALLQQRGVPILHASAVRMDGVGVGFLGGCGAGKSTMAAAMNHRGHPLLTDDIVAIGFDADGPTVLPGIPQLKLWPDAIELLGERPDLLPRIDPLHAKRARRIDEGCCAECAVPLRHLYVLCRGDPPGIEPLAPQVAFVELVSHAYGARWLRGTPEDESFRQRVELARRVPVCRLWCPRGLEHVSAIVRLVEEDVHAA